jgi:hypothetical protein
MENMNDSAMLESVRVELLQQLQDLQGAPSVAMHQVPPLFDRKSADAGDEKDPDEREEAKTKSGEGTKKQHDAEMYDMVD